ncbi:MAG: fumarylacetoacetase [Gammaproteobacteria bacterium]|nr:fumarylacetoacetase [Gammaproteobacteria bacterium]
MMRLNETHASALTSWVASANSPGCDFPIQNLPFAQFRRRGSAEAFRGGVAIGEQIVDLGAGSSAGLFTGLARTAAEACAQPSLNTFMAMGAESWSALRLALSRGLRRGAPLAEALAPCLVPQAEAEFSLPCQIGDYTNFNTSLHHAARAGALCRPDNPLQPNYKWMPVGFHGRASSIQVSGQGFHRPCGQTRGAEAAEPGFGPCQWLDHALEVGVFIGPGNELGEPIPIAAAEQHVFGVCLLNDWSARDIQAWEYQPLGPFLSKNFASTLSPWVVTMEALAPYRAPLARSEGDPESMPYLTSTANSTAGGIDINLQVLIQTSKMRAAGQVPESFAQSCFAHAYWTIAQMVAHHTVNGCNLRPGDLFGSGPQSGPAHEEAGSMLELSRGGKEAVYLSNGETRTFIEDGDSILVRAYCQRAGAARIGFGEVVSRVLPARARVQTERSYHVADRAPLQLVCSGARQSRG